MRVQVRGINKVRARGHLYYYHRATGTRLIGSPGDAEFLASYADAEKKLQQRSIGTLAGLLGDFEQTSKWRRLAESTKKEYRRIFAFWESEYGTCPYAAVEDKGFRRAILRWHDAFSADKPREADNRVTILARVLSWGTSDGPLNKNVLDNFERAYHSDRSDKIWLPEHVDSFMAVAEPEMQLALVLALHTGQRQGDILRMAWSNYDGEAITIRQGKARRLGRIAPTVRIPCTKALKATLDGLERRSTVILTTKTGRAFKKRYFAEQWDRARKAAGIVDLHFHDIRGTTVTMLSEAGCNVAQIAAVTGHSLRRASDILDKYLARTSALADTAIAKLENVLETDFAKQPAKRVVTKPAK